jgi:dephospho-CoA kinase
LIVMLSGKQGSGKTAVADRLATYWGARGIAVWRTKFAAPLYDLHDAVYAVLSRYGIEPPPPKDKDLFQILGTDWGRNKRDKDMWVKCVRMLMKDATAHWLKTGLFHIVLIDDLRHRNEFEAFPGAFTVRLECPRDIRMKRVSYWRENENHQSEVDLDGYVVSGHFGLVLDTATTTADEAANKIAQVFQAGLEQTFKRGG